MSYCTYRKSETLSQVEIKSSIALVVEFEASWCGHLVFGPAHTVVEVRFPDDAFLFEDLSHPGMVFVSELLATPGAALSVRITKKTVTIIAECEDERESHEVNKAIFNTIRSHERMFALITD